MVSICSSFCFNFNSLINPYTYIFVKSTPAPISQGFVLIFTTDMSFEMKVIQFAKQILHFGRKVNTCINNTLSLL